MSIADADLVWWPLSKSKYNDSSALVVAHLRTEDEVSSPDVLEGGRRAGTHIRIVVLDHLMRARYQTGTNVHVPIAPAQKSEIQGMIDEGEKKKPDKKRFLFEQVAVGETLELLAEQVDPLPELGQLRRTLLCGKT